MVRNALGARRLTSCLPQRANKLPMPRTNRHVAIVDKKKATWRFRTTPVEAINTSTTIVVVREGTSDSPGTALRPMATILRSPSMVEKILGGVIPPADKENVKKSTQDQVVMKFFHIIVQVSI